MYLAKQKLFDRAVFSAQREDHSAPVTLYRDALKQGKEQLRQFHEQGASSKDLVEHHAWLIDQMLELVWQDNQHLLPKKIPVALLAVGGYGRGELHPHSDIDLMLLLRRNDYEKLRDFSEAFFRFLWDIGLEVGHSVRSIKDCVHESKQDLTVITNIMESRLLQGDASLLEDMRIKTGTDYIWPADKFFTAKVAEAAARHKRFDDTAYNLEPNLKDGPGGLRDIQTVCWVMQRRYDVTDLKDLVQIEFLTEDEYRALIRGRNFLWRLRNGLHFIAKRREDRLLFDHQRTLAKQLGYVDNEHNLAVEQLMKRYYRTIKELRLLNEILIQHYEESNYSGRAKVKAINRRFRAFNGYLETVDNKVFTRFPIALLELFSILQQSPELKGVRAGTIRQVRANLHLINQQFRDDIRARSLFMEMMRYRTGHTRVLRRMNAYGVLGAYIPAFGAIVGQMQHDLFHVYTVDAHSLFVLRNIRRFSVANYRSEFPIASQLMEKLFKPERLYLAALFHDIAKGRGGDHSVLGEKEAFAFCKKHDMSDYDAHFVSWLVRNHLLLSFTAQRQDISDPEVVGKFAEQVGDQEHLNNLYILTVADIRGTSPHVWNAWKGRLLEELFHSTTRVLRLDQGAPIEVEARISDTQADALEQMDAKTADPAVVRQYWATLPRDYFLRHSAAEIAWHASILAQASAISLPLVSIRHDPDLKADLLFVYAAESEFLLCVVTSALTQLKFNIADARLQQSKTGFALYTFIALASNTDAYQDRDALQKRLRDLIIAGERKYKGIPQRLSRTQKHFPIATNISFTDSGANYTVMEVIAQDQPGLLHRVADCLLQCKVRLINAKIATYGERVEDVFFICDRDGVPVDDPQQRDCLSQRIKHALDPVPVEQEQKVAGL